MGCPRHALLLALAIVAAPAIAQPVRDTPSSAAAVRACERQGPNFVALPGTTTCLRIGGRVVAEAGTASRSIDRDRIAGFRSRAQVSLDARTPTEYGPLRSFVRLRAGDGVRSRD